MLPQTSRLLRRLAQWPCTLPRRHSSSSNGTPSFDRVRAEMLSRDVTCLIDQITPEPSFRLAATLRGFLPEQWYQVPTNQNPILPISHYLIYFNPTQPSDSLLPDGTDLLHSPGKPWVRRMWAGGSVHLRPDKYSHQNHGLKIKSMAVAAERIKDVQLVGKEQDAKIFLTVERRYARLDRLFQRHRKTSDGIEMLDVFKQQLRDDDEWGDALLKTDYKLVFLKERTAAELEAIKAGQWITPKYLDRPGDPQFSHSFTPTPALLFRYSALTFNSHLIHLDRDYARSVEGHRNLLVHGPLSLTIMLQAISSHLETQMSGEQIFKSIEYRNLAPLYCNEKMTVCGMEKKTLYDGSLYDVWIEGPTGGVAVKGTVRTARSRFKTSAPSPPLANPERSIPSSIGERDTHRQVTTVENQQHSTVSQDLDNKAIESRRDETLGLSDSDTAGFSASNQRDSSLPGASEHLKRLSRTNPHEFFLPPESPSSVRRVNATPKLPSPTMSLRSRRIANRAARVTAELSIDPVPILRYHHAKPYEPDVDMVASRHSQFKRDGPRTIKTLRLRYKGQSLDEFREQEEAIYKYKGVVRR